MGKRIDRDPIFHEPIHKTEETPRPLPLLGKHGDRAPDSFHYQAPPSQLARALRTEDLHALALLGCGEHSQLRE